MRPALLLAVWLGVPAVLQADTLTVRNGAIRFGFDARDGALIEMMHVANGKNLLDGSNRLWQLDLFEQPGKVLSAGDAKRFTHRMLATPQRGIELTWTDFGLPEAPALRVVATMTLQGDSAISDWRIALEQLGDLRVEQVRFPRVEHIVRAANEELVLPRWMGTLTRNVQSALTDTAGKPRRLQYDYPGALAMQMVALYDPRGTGFYAASHDTLAYRKSFAVWSNADSTRGYELVHPLPDPQKTKTRWSPEYTAVLGTFTGDWVSAAERYRNWGSKQVWARESRLQKGLVPKWLLDTGMWVWNRGRSGAVLPHAKSLQDALGLPVSVFWHWWHHGPYDTSFPDYLPPREGEESFIRAVADADKAGLRAMVYMNQRLWCIGQPSWGPQAEAAAVKERDGKVRTEVYNIFDPKPCATMDVTTQYWRDKYAGIADTVIDKYGLHGIYMDQAVLSLMCWDPTHNHPLGGGNYWVEGFRKLESQIRANTDKPVMLTGEGAGEAWLPSLDLMLTLQISQERYTAPSSGWEPIPLFQAVYHAFGVTYGSYSSLVLPPYDELWPAESAPADSLALFDVKFRQQFFLEQARAFAWGLQPTIANFRTSQLTERPQEVAYMMRLAQLRAQKPDYLLRGTFLRPPALDVPSVNVDLSRVSIYAARRGGPTVSQAVYPAAIAGAWRSPRGDVAFAVASILDQPVTARLTFDLRNYGLSGSGVIRQTDEQGTREVGKWSAATNTQTLEMRSGGAAILEFVREAGWTLESTLRVRRVSAPVISPDGKLAAVVISEPYKSGDTTSSSSLHVYPLDVPRRSTPILSSFNASAPTWVGGGEFLAYARPRNGVRVVWRVPARGGEPEAVTPLDRSVGEFRFSADGQWLAFTAADPDTVRRHVAREVGEDSRFARLYVTRVDGMRNARLLTPANYQVGGHVGAGLDGPGITWSPDGTSIAFTHSPSPLGDDWVHADVSVVDVQSGAIRSLLNSKSAEGGVMWSPDGKWIAVAISDAPATYALTTRIHIVSPTTGELRPLAESFDRRPSLIGWNSDAQRVFIFEGRGVGNRLSALPLDGGARVDLSPDTLLLAGPNLGARGSMIGFTSESSTRPPEAFVASLDRFAARRVTSIQPDDLPAAPRTEAVRWNTQDGKTVEGLLTYPAGWQQGARAPLLVILHGGPPSAFTNSFTGRFATYPIAVFAQHGFAVLRPNVRGSAGYGRDFRYANVRDWGGGDARDVLAGVDALVARGIVDSARVGVMGWSYGGYLTAITIARTTRFRAASVGAGITDLVSYSGTADIPGFVPSYYGGDFWENAEAYRTGSAIANVSRITTPTLIQHGDQDARVPIGQGYQLYYALKRRGIPVRMLVYPGQGHGIGDLRMQLEAARANVDWFGERVK